MPPTVAGTAVGDLIVKFDFYDSSATSKQSLGVVVAVPAHLIYMAAVRSTSSQTLLRQPTTYLAVLGKDI
jgi:hypothetical protein